MSDDEYDDDDFDEYEDDFEDDGFEDEGVANASDLKARMEEENRRVMQGSQDLSRPQSAVSLGPRSNQQSPQFSQTRKYVAPKSKKSIAEVRALKQRGARAQEILKQVTMVEEDFTIFEMPEVTPEQFFNRMLTSGQRRSVATQSDHMKRNKGVQKNASKSVGVSTQFPEAEIESAPSQQRIAKFVNHAAQVIEAVIIQNLIDASPSSSMPSLMPLVSTTVGGNLGDTGFELKLPELLGERKCVATHFPQNKPRWLLTAHAPVKAGPQQGEGKSDLSGRRYGQALARRSVLCYWNLTRPSRPDKILCCDGDIMCCSMSSDRGHLAFAGLESGAVVVWDLREDRTLHQMVMPPEEKQEKTPEEAKEGETPTDKPSVPKGALLVRAASFTTDSMAAHMAPVVAIESLKAQQQQEQSDGKMDILALASSGKTTFQIASLDDSGHLVVWTVLELKVGNMAGSKHDLGMAVGSRIKLMKSSVVDTSHVSARRSYSLVLNPWDSNEFMIATSSGEVATARRFGELRTGAFVSRLSSIADPCLCIQFNPFTQNVFLAGYESGSICLFNVEVSEPISIWPNASTEPIVDLRWSNHRPAVFFALDKMGAIHLFDLLQSDQRPRQTTSIGYPLSSFSLSTPSATSSSALAMSQPLIAFPSQEGTSVQCVALGAGLAKAGVKELSSFRDYLACLC